MERSAEQKARDFLEYLGVSKAQEFTAGDVVEIAEMINQYYIMGRPKKEPGTGKNKTVPVRMKKDFYARLKDFKELTGFSISEILRRGAIMFINDWHDKKQESYED